MKFTILSLLVAGALAGPIDQRTSYTGSKVFRVSLTSKADVTRMTSLIDSMGLDMWTHDISKGKHVDVMVAPNDVQKFQRKVQGLVTNVMHEDLGKSIEEESKFEPYVRVANAPPSLTWFNSYHTMADHNQWLKDLAAAYPNNAEIVSSGTSGQGNDITGIHIYGSKSTKGTKPAAIFHGTVHAREWIATPTVEYLAYQLLLNTTFANKFDFYIFPIVNPDGFSYTQTKTRLWRKNLAKNSGSSCLGTDLNRNWPFKWDVPGGASTDPCADDYRGSAAGNQIENKAFRAFIDTKTNATAGAALFIDFHAYSQLIMSPFGYTCDASALPPNNNELQTIMKGWEATTQAVHGTKFTYGPICSTIYQATGSSIDWTYTEGVKYNFAIELRDTGNYGFVLPAKQIVPSGEEMWAGVNYMLGQLKV